MKKKPVSPSKNMIATATGDVAVTGQNAVKAKKALKLAKTRYKSAKKTLKRARKAARKAAKLARKARRRLDKLQRQIPKAKENTTTILVKGKVKPRQIARLATLTKPATSVPQPE
jgi:chromosome segregation ATPase